MAEFKLGRIKFVYQGTWATTRAYVVDDVVSVSGKSYICIVSHTSSSLFATDLTSSYWSLIADGTTWKGTWAQTTYYNAGDQVQWGGIVYVCKTPHTSATYVNPTYLGLENDQNKWDAFATGFSWQGAWTNTTRYKLNDIVSYGGYVYICTTYHISAATDALGLEANSGNWATFNAGLSYKGTWSGSTVRYKQNDIVVYGASLWICTTYHTSSASFDGTKWSVFVSGIEFRGAWANVTVYQYGDIVSYGGNSYIAIQNHTGQNPSTANAYWNLFTQGFSFQGDWVSSTSYRLGQVARLGGYTYIALLDNTTQTLTVTGTTISSDGTSPNQITTSGNTSVLVVNLPITFASNVGGLVSGTTYYVKTIVDATHFTVSAISGGTTFAITSTTTGQSVVATTNPSPPFATYWTRLNSGFRWAPTNSTYTAISGLNISSVGSGATFNVTTNNTVYSVVKNAGGSNYQVNDTIRLLGSNLGGISPANDVTVTVATVSSGAILTVTTSGIAVTWVSGTSYVLGDVVMFGASSYVCVLAHVGATGNRPDNDTTAIYWNLQAAGTEQAVLTTQGDMFYYGANGSQRLPIGTDGQILRVNNNAPAWSYYGTINNLVYVGPTGVDTIGNGQGLTIDKPWKTVRYAAKQVEDGYLNTNATSLLAKNKQFLIKETNNYVTYNYSFNITASVSATNSFTVGAGTYQATTATMYVNMPIVFTGTVGGVTAGQTYYVQSIINTTSFTISLAVSGSALGVSSQTANMTGTYSYSATKTERDAGYVVDAVIFDLGHAGTKKSTAAAQAYVTTTGLSSGVASYDVTPFVACLNYLSGTLISSVLNNTAPTSNYQTLNGVSAGSQGKQITDTTLTAETTASTTAASLIGIVTGALTTGSSVNIPTAIQPNTTISVKTGTYNETLPIVVPSNTAIVGDELRSTVIQPRTANLIMANDKPKSIDALGRVKTLLSNIVSNTVVTPTSGNAQVISVTSVVGTGTTVTLTFAVQSSAPFAVGQYITVSGFSGGATGYNGSQIVTSVTTSTVSYSNGTTAASAGTPVVTSQVTGLTAGDTGSNAAVQAIQTNTTIIQNILVNGLSQVPAFSFTNPTGYNSTYLVNWGDGKGQVVNNYAFIKDEIAAFLNVSYQWSTYGVTNQGKTIRDLSFILDALQYDMTYGCNNQSLIVGSSYYSIGVNQLYAPYIAYTIAALTRLKAIISQIVQKTAVSPSAGNTTTQITSGTAGSAASAAFAQARVQDVIDWINNGVGTATSATFTGSITTTTLSVTGNVGTISVGQIVTGGTVAAGTYIVANVSGTGTSATSSWTVSVSQSATATGTTNTITPVTSGSVALASSALQTAYNALIARQSEIAADAQVWVYKFYQNQNISQGLTTRDAGLVVQALAYDMVLGTNFNSLQAGRRYQSINPSNANLLSSELNATSGAINFIGYKSKQIAASGSVAAASTTIDDIINYIYGQISFNTVTTGVVGGTQTIAYTTTDVITVTVGSSSATFSPTLTAATPNLSITYISTGGVATFATTVSVVKGQSVLVSGASGGMSPGTYYVTSTATSTTSVTLSSSYANAVSGTPGSFTGGAVTSATVTIGSTYNTVSSVTVVSGGSWTTTPSATQATTVNVSSGAGLTVTLNFGASSYSTTASVATTSTNVITVGSTAGMAVGMPIKFSALPTNIITTSSATTGSATNTITLGATTASLGIAAGQIVYFTGSTANGVFSTYGTNIVPYQNYYVINPTGSTIQIALTSGGAAIQLITATVAMNVYVNNAGGLVNSQTYWINTIPSGTTLTVASSIQNVGVTATAITNTVSGMTALVTAGAKPEVNGTITYNNTVTTINGAEILRANANFLAYEASAYTAAKYTGTVTNTVASTGVIQTSGAHNLTVGDPVRFTPTIISTTATATAVTTNQITLGTTTGVIVNMPVVFTGSTFGGVNTGTTYYVKTIPSAGQITVTQFQSVSTTATATSTSGNYVTLGTVYGLTQNQPIVFTGTTANGITNGTTYYVASIVPASNQISLVTTSGGSTPVTISATGSVSFTVAASNPAVVLSTATGTMTATIGGIIGGLSTTTTYYVLTTPSTSQLTLSTVQVNQGTQTTTSVTDAFGQGIAVSYYFVPSLCVRDTTEFIKAIVYDLQYPGNYKSLRSAELYVNAVTGSTTANMFLVRDGTGLRNMTMNGLVGYLSAANQYGTKRPTAGAYASLDPGFGPNDSNVWIINRSCYTQNCTMFGTACVGAKVDGSLHNGGNRSMVANDYTTLLSDGIGYWVTGSNALAELVSVFNYYGYAGYLAEFGGKIRATNGNSSYGTYGVVAEGSDTYEQAITGTVNNRYFPATVTNVVTDAFNSVLRFEYGNAGSNYTNSVASISGSGYNAAATHDEIRDSAVFETRLIDNGDGTSTSAGGTSYVTATNTAQSGAVGTISLAATDAALSTAYIGMRIQITAGTGVGQYGNIIGYSNGTKIMNVVRDTFVTLTITATTNGSPSTVTVASTATLYVNMPFYVATTVGGLVAGTVYYVQALSSATTFTVASASNGAAFTSQITTTTSQSVALYAAGWDHVIPGTSITNVLDLSTTYLIEPRIQYSGPGYLQTARTLSATATWQSMTYGAGYFVGIANGSTSTTYSVDGKNWSTGGALSASTMIDVIYGGGQGATATAVLGGFGGQGAVLTAVLGTGVTANQVVSVTVVNGGTGYTTPPTILFVSASGSGATATCTVLNGAIQAVTISIPGSGYATAPTVNAATSVISSITANTWGKNYFNTPTITITAPFSATLWSSAGTATQGTYYYYVSTVSPYPTNYYVATSGGTFATGAGNGPVFTLSTGSSTNGTVSLTYIGTLPQVTVSVTNYGASSYTITNGGYGYTAIPTVVISDSTAKFVSISSSATTTNYSTVANLSSSWTAGNALPTTGFASLAYGGGVFVAVGSTANATSSGDGVTWISRTIPTLGSGSYSAVTYGNGYFVALQTGGTATAVSSNGVSWTASTNALPSNTTWTSIAYGNGRFVALAATGAIAICYNVQLGASALTWASAPTAVGTTTSVLSSTYTWTQVRYGGGLFFAIAQGTSICATSPDGITWSVQAMPSSSNWKALAFGNPISNTIGAQPIWVAGSATSGTIGASIRTGATTAGRIKLTSGAISEIRIVEPGSGYSKGNVTATTVTTNVITVDDTFGLVDSMSVVFTGASTGGLVTSTIYYVIGSTIVLNTSFKVSATAGSATPVTLSTQTVTGTYRAGPIVTQTDPNKVKTAAVAVRVSDGVLGNPSFSNRGTSNTTATAITVGDGFSDFYQNTAYLNINGLFGLPTAGANVQFGTIYSGTVWTPSTSVSAGATLIATSISTSSGVTTYTYNVYTVTTSGTTGTTAPTGTGSGVTDGTAVLNYIGQNPNTWYKLVATTNILGIPGNYTMQFQVNPSLTTANAPAHNTAVTTRLKFSQVRLTGHDFLYIGTGNQTTTNYPYVNASSAIQANQTNSNGGGHVFFTSTDQDGNFNVGGLFGVQQATGTATLNASAFNLAGLQSLTLGSVSLGVGSATITQFSTDPYFTANSDSVVPTQKAIKSYITAQIGGGSSSLNVNTLTAGIIYIAGSNITTTNGAGITVSAKLNFVGGIDGAPVALGFFMQR